MEISLFMKMFLLKLPELKKTSSSTCKFVAEEMSTLVEVLCTSQMQYLQTILQKYQLSDPELDLFFNSMPNNLLKSSLEKFRFKITLNNYISSQEFFVYPREVNMGFVSNGKTDSMQYIPLFDTLHVLFGKDDIRTFVFFPESPSTISGFRDGTIFKNNPLFSNVEKALQIILYNDEFVCTNPLGNKTKSQLFILQFATQKKINAKQYFFLMFPCVFIERYGYETLLGPMIRYLMKLESDGIIVKVGDNDMQIFGTVSMLVAANLAQHSLCGYLDSFSKVQR